MPDARNGNSSDTYAYTHTIGSFPLSCPVVAVNGDAYCDDFCHLFINGVEIGYSSRGGEGRVKEMYDDRIVATKHTWSNVIINSSQNASISIGVTNGSGRWSGILGGQISITCK